jgi:alkylation response protein AidB-like acyl-CoA dehydrogenase
MDFSLTTEQDELRGLAARILGDATTPERAKAVTASDEGIDRDLWATMADAGLVGISLPESAGGSGLGWLETCVVLEEVGRTAAAVPALTTLALTGPALAAADPAVGADLLAGVVDGSAIVAAAVHEPVGDPFSPTTTVTDGALTGTKVCVPVGSLAAAFVVTATDGLYLVDADAPGVDVERSDTTTGVPDARVTFTGAPARCLGGPDAVESLLWRGVSAACVMTAGACAAALALTATYTVERHQFGKPIASLQAVSQRAGDAYIDTEAVRLTAWQAAWRLSEGLPCAEQLLAAKFQAAEAGWRVVHAAHHLHGGFGVDRDYPLHRFFLLHKQLELQLGSGTPSLAHLGQLLAST